MHDLLLTGEDNLRVNSWCSVAGVTLAVEGRIVDADACLVPFSQLHTPNSDRSLAQSFVGLQAGRLTNLSVRVAAGTVKRGQCWVELEIVRGLAASAQSLGVLARAYAAAGNRLVWPGAPALSSLDGPGFVRAVVGTDPIAGAEVLDTVPTGARWKLRSVLLDLVTSAVVANRAVLLQITDGANLVAEFGSVTTQGASKNWRWTLARFGQPIIEANSVSVQQPLGDLVLLAGWQLKTSTLNLDAGDNYAAPIYDVEEWIEP